MLRGIDGITMNLGDRLRQLFFPKKRGVAKDSLDILLLTAPPWGTHNPPTGLAYLSTFLKANGIAADVFDANIEFYRRIDPKYHKLWLPENKGWWTAPEKFAQLRDELDSELAWVAEKALSYGAPLLGFSVVDPKERMTIDIIRRILAVNDRVRIVMGGPAMSTEEQRRIFLRNLGGKIDYFVEGQGEEILLELVLRYRSEGFAAPREKNTEPLVVGKKIKDLDGIPFPRYEEFNFRLYDGGGFFVEWSRGCISRCAYCKGRHLLGSYRMKSHRHILEELEYLHGHYGFSHFIVCDNLLNGDVRELALLCDSLIACKMPISWEGQAIPYRRMTRPLLEKMREAGCTKLQWGLESGSDVLLNNVYKGKIFTVAEVEQVLSDSHAAGLGNEIFLIVGLPGENEEEFAKTLSFIERNRANIDVIKSVNTLHLVHGTDLFDQASTTFDLELPPEDDWYFRWQARDGNNDYPQRRARARRLLELAEQLALPVLEHNLHEGGDKD